MQLKLMSAGVRNSDNPEDVCGFTKDEVNKIIYFVDDMISNEYKQIGQFSFVDRENKKNLNEDLKNGLYIVALNPISFKSDKVSKIDALKFASDLEDRIRKSKIPESKVQSLLQGGDWNIRVVFKKMRKYIRKQEFDASVDDTKNNIRKKFIEK